VTQVRGWGLRWQFVVRANGPSRKVRGSGIEPFLAASARTRRHAEAGSPQNRHMFADHLPYHAPMYTSQRRHPPPRLRTPATSSPPPHAFAPAYAGAGLGRLAGDQGGTAEGSGATRRRGDEATSDEPNAGVPCSHALPTVLFPFAPMHPAQGARAAASVRPCG
jgi:hypothetical protein